MTVRLESLRKLQKIKAYKRVSGYKVNTYTCVYVHTH